MALDFKFELTDKGKRLLAKAMAGTQLEFTRFSVGAGKLTTQIPAELTALIQPIIDDIEIAVLKPMDHTALIGCQVDNKDITVGFSWTETGLFAQDPELGEILFCYANLGTAEIPVPPNTESSYSRKVRIHMVWSESVEISISFNQSGIYALREEVGDIAELETKDKTNVVMAMNEVNAAAQDAKYIVGDDDGKKYRWGKDEKGIYFEEIEDGETT